MARLTAKQWNERVEAWKASGKTAEEFALPRGIDARQLHCVEVASVAAQGLGRGQGDVVRARASRGGAADGAAPAEHAETAEFADDERGAV